MQFTTYAVESFWEIDCTHRHYARDKSLILDTSKPSSRRQLYSAIRALPSGSYAIKLKRKRWQASDAQRGYYWGYLVVEVSRLIKKDRDQTDRILNALFLTRSWEVAGQYVNIVLSLSDLDALAVSDYFRQIRLWVWQMYRVRLREPDPDCKLK